MTTACDGCGKPRRPYRYEPDGDDPKGLAFCFPCVKAAEREEAKACPCGESTRCANPATCVQNR